MSTIVFSTMQHMLLKDLKEKKILKIFKDLTFTIFFLFIFFISYIFILKNIRIQIFNLNWNISKFKNYAITSFTQNWQTHTHTNSFFTNTDSHTHTHTHTHTCTQILIYIMYKITQKRYWTANLFILYFYVLLKYIKQNKI